MTVMIAKTRFSKASASFINGPSSISMCLEAFPCTDCCTGRERQYSNADLFFYYNSVFSTKVYRRVPCPRLAQTSKGAASVCFDIFGVFVSLSQPFVCQTLSSNRTDKTIEPIPRMPPDVTFIQTEGKLIDVTSHVFFAGMMIDTVQSAF
jgi:hypothetical protein